MHVGTLNKKMKLCHCERKQVVLCVWQYYCILVLCVWQYYCILVGRRRTDEELQGGY